MSKLSPTLEAGQSVLSRQGFKEFFPANFQRNVCGTLCTFWFGRGKCPPILEACPYNLFPWSPWINFHVIFSLTCLVWGSNVWVRYPSWKLSPQPTLFYPYVKVLFTLYCVNNILYMHPLDQYPTFIMLWDVANLRPIRYTKCPPYSKGKWSRICCISKQTKLVSR